jgi:hypothetical protein
VNGKFHEDMTVNSLLKQGFDISAAKMTAVGNLLIDTYSNKPEFLSALKLGPRNSECARFHFDNLLTPKDVRDNWGLLQRSAEKAFRESAKKCNCELILLQMGVILHAVQDFYSHSNWVEEWDNNGYKVSRIPTWDESEKLMRTNPNEQVAKDAVTITNSLHTGEFWANRKKVKKNVETHDDLNKDAPNSKRGIIQSQFTRVKSYHDLARTLGERATDQWEKKIESWVRANNSNCSVNSLKPEKGFRRKIADENRELRNLFEIAGRWEENKDQEKEKITSAYLNWGNRFLGEMREIVGKDFKEFREKNPMNRYL